MMPSQPNQNQSLAMWSRVFRLRGTVILHIWWQVILVLLFTTGIIFLHLNKFPIYFPSPILIDVMGVVTGLLLAFRTQTSYERFSQGRDLWCQMNFHIRNLTRLIWTGVPAHESRNIVEKKSAINLVLAFAVATKHYLREEFGYKYADLSNLLSHITTNRAIPKDVSLSHKDTFDEVITTQRDLHSTNIPLEISYYISSYIQFCQNPPWGNPQNQQPKCDEIVIAAMQKTLSGLVECLTSFEKIRKTPIPIAYSVHITHLTWLYTLAIPIQIVSSFGWVTLPIVGFAAFAFLGILEIGQEIENPFSYEANDLPLDQYCDEIRSEIDQILMQSPVRAQDWIFSAKNMPFYPKSFQIATELVKRTPTELKSIIQRPEPGPKSSETEMV